MDNLITLPYEILCRIFSFLEPQDLLAAARVSKLCWKIVQDENTWRAAFRASFGSIKTFSPLASSWRQEYSSRVSLTSHFQEGRGKKIIFDARIGIISHLIWNERQNQFLAFSLRNGIGCIGNTLTGKTSNANIFHGSARFSSSRVTAFSVSGRFAIYGFESGLVGIRRLPSHCGGAIASSRDSLQPCTPQLSRAISVLSACLVDSEIPAGSPTVAAGDQEGNLVLWNHLALGDPISSLRVGSEALLEIQWDQHNARLFCLDAMGVTIVSLTKGESTLFFRQPRSKHISIGALRMLCDFSGNRFFLYNSTTVCRHKLDTRENEEELMSHRLLNTICAAALDPTERGLQISIPGGGGRFCAFADTQGFISIFDSRAHECEPLLQIATWCASISQIALNAAILVYGSLEGSIVAYDVLRGRYLTRLSKRDKGETYISNYDAESDQVQAIVLSADRPSGIVAIGGRVRTFYLSASQELIRNAKHANRKRQVACSGLKTTTKTRLQHEIAQDLAEIEDEEKRCEAQNEHIHKLAHGITLCDLSEGELIDYAKMLSAAHQEDYIQTSLENVVPGNTQRRDQNQVDHARPVAGSNFEALTQQRLDEEYELALALSRSLM